MNRVINAFGGRKYFYCSMWCIVATALLWFGKIQSLEWVGLISWFFTNVVVANNREAVEAIKATSAPASAPVIAQAGVVKVESN